MTIKIIKRGFPKVEIPIQAVCKSCHSIIEFTKQDARISISRNQLDGPSYSVVCPVCTKMVVHYT